MGSGWVGLPKPDDRRNEWSPMPAGGIVAAFVAPVSIILLWGMAIEPKVPMKISLGVLSLIFGIWAIWSACDAAYVAGMRRISDQDLRKD